MLRQLISLMGLGAAFHHEGLHRKCVDFTVDCSGSNIHHGYAGVSDTSISMRGCLGMVIGRTEGTSGPTEAHV